MLIYENGELYHADDMGEVIEHYGVKGMRWGVRRAGRLNNKFRKTLKKFKDAESGSGKSRRLVKKLDAIERKANKAQYKATKKSIKLGMDLAKEASKGAKYANGTSKKDLAMQDRLMKKYLKNREKMENATKVHNSYTDITNKVTKSMDVKYSGKDNEATVSTRYKNNGSLDYDDVTYINKKTDNPRKVNREYAKTYMRKERNIYGF